MDKYYVPLHLQDQKLISEMAPVLYKIGLFIDNYADAEGVIMHFKEYLESENYYKCWHNYSFDRHMFYNHGINVKGLGGDTMHLARLADPSRIASEYSLAQLSKIYDDQITQAKIKIVQHQREINSKNPSVLALLDMFEKLFQSKNQKIDIITLFGSQRTLKTGKLAAKFEFPKLEEIHSNPAQIMQWIEYSSFDAEITYFLREALSAELCRLKTNSKDCPTLYNLYHKYWLPFGELLTDIERIGIKIDLPYLKKIQLEAEKECSEHETLFLKWVHSIQEDAKEFNPNSTMQMQHLLFAPYYKIKSGTSSAYSEEEDAAEDKTNEKKSGYVGEVKTFKVENTNVRHLLGSN